MSLDTIFVSWCSPLIFHRFPVLVHSESRLSRLILPRFLLRQSNSSCHREFSFFSNSYSLSTFFSSFSFPSFFSSIHLFRLLDPPPPIYTIPLPLYISSNSCSSYSFSSFSFSRRPFYFFPFSFLVLFINLLFLPLLFLLPLIPTPSLLFLHRCCCSCRNSSVVADVVDAVWCDFRIQPWEHRFLFLDAEGRLIFSFPFQRLSVANGELIRRLYGS